MQGALINLLTIAATKFWTSIAGVLASIILRLAARRRRQAIERRRPTSSPCSTPASASRRPKR
jgi:hypothetical protein